MRVHHAGPFVALQGGRGAPRRQFLGRLALPGVTLPAHLRDLRRSVPLKQRPERRPGLDRLQLLRITDQHDLGPNVGRVRQHPLHLPRAHQPGFIDHQHVPAGQLIAALPPRMLERGERA